MITITNQAQFKTQVAAWLVWVRKGAANAVYRMMYDAQTWATSISPVYSGDFASNWNVSYGAPDASFKSSGDDYYGMSFPEANSAPWGKGNFNLSGFRIGQTAYLTNASEHDEPYAWKIENNKISFRPVNAGKWGVRAKTLNHLKTKYPRITRAAMAPVAGV